MPNRIFKCIKPFKVPKSDENFQVPETPRFMTVKEGSTWEEYTPEEGFDLYLINTKTGEYLLLWQEELDKYFTEVPPLKSCPFCGEEAQRSSKNPHVAMHACRVLDKEIRVPDSAWNIRLGENNAK